MFPGIKPPSVHEPRCCVHTGVLCYNAEHGPAQSQRAQTEHPHDVPTVQTQPEEVQRGRGL